MFFHGQKDQIHNDDVDVDVDVDDYSVVPDKQVVVASSNDVVDISSTVNPIVVVVVVNVDFVLLFQLLPS